MQPVVGQHLHGLVGGSDDIWTEARGHDTQFNTLNISQVKFCAHCQDLPLVVLAGQRSIHQLADGSRVADVVDDHNQRQLYSALPVDLVRHIGEIQLQLLAAQTRQVYLTLSHSRVRNVKKKTKNLKVGSSCRIQLSSPSAIDDAC